MPLYLDRALWACTLACGSGFSCMRVSFFSNLPRQLRRTSVRTHNPNFRPSSLTYRCRCAVAMESAAPPEKLPPKKIAVPPQPPYMWSTLDPSARLVYVRNHTDANTELDRLSTDPLGFDLEWRPNFIKGHPENRVSLVQLANQDTIFLIQVSAMQGKASVRVVSTSLMSWQSSRRSL